MTNKEASKEILSHMFYLGMTMPDEWLKTHGEDSKFQKAMMKALEALEKADEVEDV